MDRRKGSPPPYIVRCTPRSLASVCGINSYNPLEVQQLKIQFFHIEIVFGFCLLIKNGPSGDWWFMVHRSAYRGSTTDFVYTNPPAKKHQPRDTAIYLGTRVFSHSTIGVLPFEHCYWLRRQHLPITTGKPQLELFYRWGGTFANWSSLQAIWHGSSGSSHLSRVEFF